MKRFSYTLETVLAHREILEEAEQLGFADITRRLAAERDLLETQIRKGEELSAELAEKERTRFEMHESRLYHEYLSILEEEIRQTHARVRKLEEEFLQRREQLLRATRSRKVLDAHRNREHSRYIHEADLEEQKGVDEIASLRHPRTRTAEGRSE